MCGSLKHENLKACIGDLVAITNILTKEEGKVPWSGFAQREKINWWLKQGATNQIVIKADSFVEGKTMFVVPNGVIYALGIREDIRVRGKLIAQAGSIKVVTRAAVGEYERSIHPRFPVILDTKGNDVVFVNPQRSLL